MTPRPPTSPLFPYTTLFRSYPGKPVAGHGQCQQQPEVGADEGPGQYRQDQQAADVVQAAAHIIAVFAEVERIELGKGAELAAGGGLLDAGIGHGCSPLWLWVCYWILPAGRCRGFALIPNSCFWRWSDIDCIECFSQPCFHAKSDRSGTDRGAA